MTITLARTRRIRLEAPPCAPLCDDTAPILPDESLEFAWQVAKERRFGALNAAYARQGGCLSADQLAEWFVRPHALQAGRSPATRLACDPGSVKEAARMDRFINRW